MTEQGNEHRIRECLSIFSVWLMLSIKAEEAGDEYQRLASKPGFFLPRGFRAAKRRFHELVKASDEVWALFVERNPEPTFGTGSIPERADRDPSTYPHYEYDKTFK